MRLAAISTASMAALALAAPAAIAAPPQGASHYAFKVLRDGSEVGSHTFDFDRSGDTIGVRIATNIAVKIVFVTVYRFEHQARETWRLDRLVELRTKTNDDGTAHHLEAAASVGGLVVNADGNETKADANIVPASLWNIRLVKQGVLLNSLDGTQMPVTVADLGDERVTVRGGQAMAHHYHIDGGLKRDVWYDTNQNLVRVKFAAKDNSTIVYELQ